MRFLILCSVLLLASCSSIPKPTPYKMDVQQGNVVTQDMVSKLRPGMTRAQVRFVLGTPLVTNTFHPNRWDYVYQMERRGKRIEERKLTVVFEGDQLARVEGDVVPAAPEDAAKAGAEAPVRPAAP